MSAIEVRGLSPLNGKIEIQGSKNAVLPMMAATLLARGLTVIRHVPAIADVFCMIEILRSLGCVCQLAKGVLTVDSSVVDSVRIPEGFVGKMRSSVMVLGPLLARMGEAVTYYPGGCVLGKRPIDIHLKALESLGAETYEAGGMILARSNGLKGNRIIFRFPSVGATENALMAAVTAEGTTVLSNCAREPEIVELCAFLTAMGARIEHAGESELVIQGVRMLHPCEFSLGADRICAGTYLTAALMVSGDVVVSGLNPEYLDGPLRLMERMGAVVQRNAKAREIRVTAKERPCGFETVTGPYPAFPTDLQSPFLAAAAVARGESRIEETVFEARFAAALRLRDFGAVVRLSGCTAQVEGRYPLFPAIVRAPDLRGGAALILAALAAEGASVIDGCEHIERGYEDICRDLLQIGADVRPL
ncbi:MAG: UDP-N-acetylglucosamine 1-carboxyvinyltransferase [Lachnospiraceae bacterium]|nr:UDP-N-acetylglucosamine 1-carboxyvinyltransferase [Lachnospiraceae bacterium]